MRTYFNHIYTYHISYAAFPNSSDNTAYPHVRKYLPEKSGLKGTDLTPDFFPKGPFEQGMKHDITVIKRASDLFMRISNSKQVFYRHFEKRKFPVIKDGRINLRHIYTRSAHYQNFKVSVRAK